LHNFLTYIQWHAEGGGANGATDPGIQAKGHPNSKITKIKMLYN